jgi:putative DNA primase/helicase
MRWTGTHYTGTDEAGILAEVYRYLDTALRAARTGLVPFGSVKRDVTNVIGALNARCHLPQESCFPGWRGTDGHPAHEVIPMENGLFHYPTETLAAHTPSFLNTSARPFAYSPLATCHGWPDFLDSLWGSDEEAKEALAEIFGYLLSGATNLQKIFLLIGPPRCGKGTIMRVLRALMGEDAYCGPTLSGLTMNFGLQSLIGKSVAVISDARIGARTDQSIAVERLLAVSGEDTITADRKNKTAWTGRMGVRFVLTTNELPRLSDASGALSNRFMPIVLTKSFLGCEDTTLDARLAQDLPGIFLWALDGLKRLNARGRFHVPESSSQLVEEFHDLTSPVGAFVREYCELGTGKKEEVGDVYRAWGRWCLASGRDRQGTTHELARQLRAVVPGLRTTRIQKKGSRNRYYVGIALV